MYSLIESSLVPDILPVRYFKMAVVVKVLQLDLMPFLNRTPDQGTGLLDSVEDSRNGVVCSPHFKGITWESMLVAYSFEISFTVQLRQNET